MNQKTAVIASGAVAVALLTGCSISSYEYRVSGTVEKQQIDYDCPGKDIAMAPIGFSAKGGRGGGGGSKGNRSKPKRPKKAPSSGSRESKPEGSKKSVLPGGGTRQEGGTSPNRLSISKTNKPVKSSKPIKNKGIKLSEKPDSPERVNAPDSVGLKSKGCENEYEIFVRNKKGDLYEQDVRKVDYDKCLKARVPSGQKAKLFPLCTTG